MYEREVMEKNLATLLGQEETYNYSSVGSSVEEDPINPFQKRVFEKKLKRSTVSENKYNIRHTSTVSCNVNEDFIHQIDHIFTQSQVELEKVRRKVLNHVEGMDERQKIYKMKEFMENLTKTMDYVCQYAEKNVLEKEKDNRDYKSLNVEKENKQNTDYNKRSTFQLQTYECNDKSLQSIEPQESINYYVERKGKNKKKEHKQNKRALSGSMVSNSKKSIYQSVLQERQLRKSKKKMI